MRWLLSLVLALAIGPCAAADPLPGTAPLTIEGDLAKRMVEGIHHYLDRETENSIEKRRAFWKPDLSSPEAYSKSIEPNRERFKKLIGVVDPRVPPRLEYVGGPDQPALVAEAGGVKIQAVRWAVLPGMNAEGLLLQPAGKPVGCVVALPDASDTPEKTAFVTVPRAAGEEAVAPEPARNRFALALAQRGLVVLVPTLIDRNDTWSNNPAIQRFTNQPHREFVHRMAFEMGRHIIGYEVQKVLAAVDYFSRDRNHPPIGVIGEGEGGLIAFYSGAVDQRIQVTGVSGYLGLREDLHKEPIYRHVWGLLREFGDEGVADLIAPRQLIVESSPGPKVEGPPTAKPGRGGAAPGGTLHRFPETPLDWGDVIQTVVNRTLSKGRILTSVGGAAAESRWLGQFVQALTGKETKFAPVSAASDQRKDFDPLPRQKRQFEEAVHFTQNLLPTAVKTREQFWNQADRQSPEKWAKSTEKYRDYFHDEIIGKLPAPTKPLNPRTRVIYETAKWTGYEVVLDLYDDVICYGILLVPKGIKPNEKRPVVVCQHGLEGRPTDVCNPNKKTPYYHSFGAQLADRGFVVFAPQNPYIFENEFRQLVRKGHPLKISLYSFIFRQHERILDWLETLPFVDATRIAYYGLSYGGKVAMRIPALLLRYCAVICSGDFNEWIWKNINLIWVGSYMFTREYDMYEFNLANTFNYAEMAFLIAPRPFMVERGHDDGVGLDEWVAHEYARVRRQYSRLGIPERTEIEFFAGGHIINGQRTFAFLHRHLNWPAPGK